MCLHVYTCCYICKFWNQSICACIACMCIHVYTCVYMCTYVGHIQTTYTLLCVGAHNRPETSPGGGGNQRALLRTAMGSSPATLSRDQGPIPTPVLAHPWALHASGGPKPPPCTAHGPSNYNGHSMTPFWAPSELIWVGGAAHRSRVRQQQQHKTPAWHWLSVHVCVCMCMYLYVLPVLTCIACMLYVLYVSACMTCSWDMYCHFDV